MALDESRRTARVETYEEMKEAGYEIDPVYPRDKAKKKLSAKVLEKGSCIEMSGGSVRLVFQFRDNQIVRFSLHTRRGV